VPYREDTARIDADRGGAVAHRFDDVAMSRVASGKQAYSARQ
jgi:hypothetical protein